MNITIVLEQGGECDVQVCASHLSLMCANRKWSVREWAKVYAAKRGWLLADTIVDVRLDGWPRRAD
jgi:hypothetical protein